MQRAELHVALRKKTGKGVARSLRREGRIPGVVYGGQDPPRLTISMVGDWGHR